MKASELILKLQEQIDRHGDLQVVLSFLDDGQPKHKDAIAVCVKELEEKPFWIPYNKSIGWHWADVGTLEYRKRQLREFIKFGSPASLGSEEYQALSGLEAQKSNVISIDCSENQ